MKPALYISARRGIQLPMTVCYEIRPPNITSMWSIKNANIFHVASFRERFDRQCVWFVIK